MTRTEEAQLKMVAHCHRWGNCQRCPLGKHAKQHILGRGRTPADILIIGSSPGDAEDETGFVFHGQTGRTMDRLLEKAGLSRYPWYITNLLACRPVDGYHNGNKYIRELRTGTREEFDTCRPRIVELIDILHPKIVIFASQLAESNYSEECPVPFITVPAATQIQFSEGGMKGPLFARTFLELRDFRMDMEKDGVLIP